MRPIFRERGKHPQFLFGRGFRDRKRALSTAVCSRRLDYRTLTYFPLPIRPTSSPFSLDRALTLVYKCPATLIAVLFIYGWSTTRDLSVPAMAQIISVRRISIHVSRVGQGAVEQPSNSLGWSLRTRAHLRRANNVAAVPRVRLSGR